MIILFIEKKFHILKLKQIGVLQFNKVTVDTMRSGKHIVRTREYFNRTTLVDFGSAAVQT